MPVTTRRHVDFDHLLHDMTLVGFGGLLSWTLGGIVGLISGSWAVEPTSALRFLLAVLVLVFARRTYWEVQEWRWSRRSDGERSGFASPMWETPRAAESAGHVGEPAPAPQ